MSYQPKLSIIVPVYNSEKYLRKCLNSLVFQTMKDIEIVVIDDGSTDRSSSIIREYTEKYSRIFLSLQQSNCGQAAARNRGISVCRGEYIGFLDADDYFDLAFCETMYSAAIENNADYVACGYTDTTLDKQGNTVILKKYVASRVVNTPKDMYFGAIVSPFIHIYKRVIVEKSKARFPEGVVHEDIAFYMNMIPFIERVAVIEKPLAYRLRHSNSTTTTHTPEKVAQIFNVMDCILDFYNSNGFISVYKNEVEYMCVRILTCSSVIKISQMHSYIERKRLNEKTLGYLLQRFPGYRSNPYFQKGIQNLYIRSYSPITADFFTTVLHLKEKLKRQYI